MRKILSGMVLVLTLTAVLMGCGTSAKEQTPTDLVNRFLKAISEKNVEDIKLCLGSEDMIKLTSKNEDEKAFFNEVFSKFQGEVTAEHLKDSEAKIEVKVKGIDVGRVVDETVRVAYPMIIEESHIEEREKGEGYSLEKIDMLMTESLMNLLKNEQAEHRTGTISVIKSNNKWIIQLDEELMRILIGNVPTGYPQ